MACLQPIIVGIAGGTGAGKTVLSKGIIDKLGSSKVSYIHQDSYYRDRSYLLPEDRERINYDHPDAIEMQLLIYHLQRLQDGYSIEKPIYDFISHTRKQKTEDIPPKEVILIEGIFVLVDKRLRELIDIKVYVDTDADIRFIRRLQRDIKERGRNIDSVVKQYLGTVRIMHMEFIEPTKKYADIILSGMNSVSYSVQRVISLIKEMKASRRK
jgi:uridine kinase